jgi:hypothetical protein
MTNVSKAMEYAATFEREAMREKLDAAIAQSDYALNMEFKRREWVGLTDEEIDTALPGYPIDYKDKFARAIEAILKEKNT